MDRDGLAAYTAEAAPPRKVLVEALLRELRISNTALKRKSPDTILSDAHRGVAPFNLSPPRKVQVPSDDDVDSEPEGDDEGDEDYRDAGGAGETDSDIAEPAPEEEPGTKEPATAPTLSKSGAGKDEVLERLLKAVGGLEGRLAALEESGPAKKSVRKELERRTGGRVGPGAERVGERDPDRESRKSRGRKEREPPSGRGYRESPVRKEARADRTARAERRERRAREREWEEFESDDDDSDYRPREGYDGDSDDQESSSEEEDRRDSDRRFWRDFREVPFPRQRLQADSREGARMLRRALTDYRTVSQFVEARRYRFGRNGREAYTLARVVDATIDSLGIMRAKDELSVEIAIRRLTAILVFEETGSWETAEEIEAVGAVDLMDDRMRRKVQRSAKLRREFRSKEEREPAPVARGGKK